MSRITLNLSDEQAAALQSDAGALGLAGPKELLMSYVEHSARQHAERARAEKTAEIVREAERLTDEGREALLADIRRKRKG